MADPAFIFSVIVVAGFAAALLIASHVGSRRLAASKQAATAPSRPKEEAPDPFEDQAAAHGEVIVDAPIETTSFYEMILGVGRPTTSRKANRILSNRTITGIIRPKGTAKERA